MMARTCTNNLRVILSEVHDKVVLAKNAENLQDWRLKSKLRS